jgi:hypothetical protein
VANYDRYWDLHITGITGWYDFAPQIDEQMFYQVTTHPGELPNGRILINPPNPRVPSVVTALPIGGMNLPAAGYVASVVALDNISNHNVNADVQALAAWINDTGHVGKMRLNCHGNGRGQIGMGTAGMPAPVTWIDASHVVAWLIANGLAAVHTTTVASLAGSKREYGLVTLSVAVCMAARYETTPATMNLMGTNSSAAPASAVAQIVTSLRTAGIRGVEVTGSNEITVMGSFALGLHSTPGQLVRVLGLGMNQVPDGGGWAIDRKDGVFSITVPNGWNVSSNWASRGGTVNIPTGFQFRAFPTNTGNHPSNGWELIDNAKGVTVTVPEGWIVDRQNRTILPPLGWHVRPNFGWNTGGRIESDPLPSPMERLAHSPAKVRDIS